jgi:hypothetical protein
MPRLDDLRRDIGYGWRSFARTPAFTIAAVLTLLRVDGAVTLGRRLLSDE